MVLYKCSKFRVLWSTVVKVWGNARERSSHTSSFQSKAFPISNFQKTQGNAKENAKVRWRADYCYNYDSFKHYR